MVRLKPDATIGVGRVRLETNLFIGGVRLQADLVADWKPIRRSIPKPVFARVAGPITDDLTKNIVDERQNRRCRSKADRDRVPRMSSRPQAPDELSRLVDERDVRIAEAVDRLLSIPDDEDRRSDRIVRRAEPFAPTSYELLDEFPLRAAGVLELVDEDVTVPGFEPQAALRELIEIPEQLDGALEDTGEIDERVRIEGPLILVECDGEDSPHAAR